MAAGPRSSQLFLLKRTATRGMKKAKRSASLTRPSPCPTCSPAGKVGFMPESSQEKKSLKSSFLFSSSALKPGFKKEVSSRVNTLILKHAK